MMDFPTFKDVWFRAKRLKSRVTCRVIMANDAIRTVEIGPKGGWKYVD